MIWGLAAMIAIIVATDQLIWRPVIAWADKFKFEQVESTQRVHARPSCTRCAIRTLHRLAARSYDRPAG